VYWRGPGIYDDQSYLAAILASKICLGLVSKANRDLHIRRSIEILTLGSLLCAERTTEHMELYEDGIEAVFWNSAEECAEKYRELLTDDEKRAEITHEGREWSVAVVFILTALLNIILNVIYISFLI
jgi:spore maturation protein CgeB